MKTYDSGWRDRAACIGHDRELWFSADKGFATDDARTARAKAVCAGCPVVAECLDYGWRREYGIYGGMTATERKNARRRRYGEYRKKKVVA